MGVYEKLGVRPVIHGAGTTTRYGGSIMRPKTIEVMREAAQSLVNIDELNEAAGAGSLSPCQLYERHSTVPGCEVDSHSAWYKTSVRSLVTRAGRITRIGGRHVLRLSHNSATEAL